MSRSCTVEKLKHYIARLEGVSRRSGAISLGVKAIDNALPALGLARGALHEIAGSPELADDAAATIFVAGIAAQSDGVVIWCLRWRDLFAPSLFLAGLDLNRVIFVECGNDSGVLAAMEEALRHPGLCMVVGELRRFQTTASKRLQLAAEKSGVTALIFRRWAKTDETLQGTASVTRWRIRAAPSEALSIPAIGRPRWRVDLERARGGGEPQSWILEACDAQGRIALPAELADRPATAEERQAAA